MDQELRVDQIVASSCSHNNHGAIPIEFVRSETEQPGSTTYLGPKPADVVAGVSTAIDLGDPDHERLVKKVWEASRTLGLFQLVNHGIPEETIKKLQSVGKEFFELPQDEKEVYARDPSSESIEGYGTKLEKEVEGKKAWVDYLFHNVWPPARVNLDRWPKKPANYRDVNQEYAKYMVNVVGEILALLSKGLGLESGVIKDALGGDDLEYLLKINYYPPCPRPDLALGVVQHTDLSALTVLVPNQVPGLQVYYKDGQWMDVNYIPNALVVHIGDQIEILSNGKYKAVLHRATVNSESTRMSWPVFVAPPPEAVIGPLPQLLRLDGNQSDGAKKFAAKTYKDYQYCKLNKIPL